MMFSTWSNQKCDNWVRTSPFRGIPLGITQSNAEIRSVATNRNASPRSKISRTFPLFSFGIPGRFRVKTGSKVLLSGIGREVCESAPLSQAQCRGSGRLCQLTGVLSAVTAPSSLRPARPRWSPSRSAFPSKTSH